MKNPLTPAGIEPATTVLPRSHIAESKLNKVSKHDSSGQNQTNITVRWCEELGMFGATVVQNLLKVSRSEKC